MKRYFSVGLAFFACSMCTDLHIALHNRIYDVCNDIYLHESAKKLDEEYYQLKGELRAYEAVLEFIAHPTPET